MASTCDVSQLPETRAASAAAGARYPGLCPGATGQPPFWLPNHHKQRIHMYLRLTSVASEKDSNRSTLKRILPEQKRVLTEMSAGDFQLYMG